MLLKPRADFYGDSHPVPADVLLLIEVADSSLEVDQKLKLPLYAAGGIPEVWIVDLINRTVNVYTAPEGNGYRTHNTFDPDDTLQLMSIDGGQIAVGDMGL